MKITITENGPYKVEGAEGLELLAADGTPVPHDGDTIWLCRCGGSTNKPFCDGTHSVVGFEGAIAAVKRADG